MLSNSRKYDIVILGATGFTGKIFCEYIAGRTDLNQTLRWALAGRSRKKLDAVKKACSRLNDACAKLDLVICDSLERTNLDTLTASTRVVATTVGPYTKYGNDLVDSCVANGTHYCDITGEILWIRENIDRVHDIAVKNKAKIVHCCGFDSIPSDLGALMMIDEMHRKYNKHVSEVRCIQGKSMGGASGGTLATVVNMFDTTSSAQLKKLADPYVIGGRGQDKADQKWVRFEPQLKSWTAPFLMAAVNTRIVRRSAFLASSSYLQRYSESMLTGPGLKGWISAAIVSIASPLIMMLMYFRLSRWLIWRMFKLPNPGEGPSKKTQERGYFVTHLVAESADDEKNVLHGLVAGSKDPGYGQTAIMLAESALCLAFDQADHVTKKGGVLTPASAMGQILIKRLRKAGMIFRCSDKAPNMATLMEEILPGKERKKKRRFRSMFIFLVLCVAVAFASWLYSNKK